MINHVVGLLFFLLMKTSRTVRQLESKWDRLKNLWKKPLRELTQADSEIVATTSYRQYIRNAQLSTENNVSVGNESAVPSTSRQRDPRLRAAAQIHTNDEPSEAPDNSTAARLYALKIQHTELKIQLAKLEIARAKYLLRQRAQLIEDLS